MAVPWLKHELPTRWWSPRSRLHLPDSRDLAAGARSSVSSLSLVLERTLTSDVWCAFAVGILFLLFLRRNRFAAHAIYRRCGGVMRSCIGALGSMLLATWHVTWHGKSYVVHPPLAALITLPQLLYGDGD